VPFVLSSQPTAAYDADRSASKAAPETRRRYAEILGDVEELINDHIQHQRQQQANPSKLKHLVPAVGIFHTPLLLQEAFLYQDDRRKISSRRFVAPSFNDIRLTLNTAQLMSLARSGPLQLVTFDGDVTLYEDGQSLMHENPVIERILRLLSRGIKVAIVTAAGYMEAKRYYERLHGLVDAVKSAMDNHLLQKPTLIVLGGESNFLFEFDATVPDFLRPVPRPEWEMDEMQQWSEHDVTSLLDTAEAALLDCVHTLELEADVLRKQRAVGIVPTSEHGGRKFTREQLEETVLVVQQMIEMSRPKVPFCAFNGELFG
jgi:IMP and pyridine-specific 5'-nucleotidase